MDETDSYRLYCGRQIPTGCIVDDRFLPVVLWSTDSTDSYRLYRWFLLPTGWILASHADVLRHVTRSSPRTSAQRTGHIRSLAVSQS